MMRLTRDGRLSEPYSHLQDSPLEDCVPLRKLLVDARFTGHVSFGDVQQVS